MPKKPLASCTRLVAMINVVICARIHRPDCIGSPFSGGLSRKQQHQATRSCHDHARPIHSRPKDPIIVTWRLGELPSYAPARLV